MKKIFLLLIVAAAFFLFWLAEAWRPSSVPRNTPSAAASGMAPGVTTGGETPLYSFLNIALGGFRGLISDALWLRATDLQEKRRLLELVQLAGWITRLEPHSIDTWSYQSWNLAYNISVLFDNPADRWLWVKHGLRLIRDVGVDMNRNDPKIYWETGWLYLHKIGGTSDDAAPYYRQQLAREVESVCPSGRVGESPSNEFLEAFHLDRDLLQAFEKRFGAMDWRLPETHAAYWAFGGRQVAGQEGSVSCDRMMVTAMIDLFFKGRLHVDSGTGVMVQTPDFARLDSILTAFDIIERSPRHEWVREIHNSFLDKALLFLLAFGEHQQIRNLLSSSRMAMPAWSEEAMRATMYDLAAAHVQRQSQASAKMLVMALFDQAFRCQAHGYPQLSRGYAVLAIALATALDTTSNSVTIKYIARESWQRVCRELPESLRDRLIADGPEIVLQGK